MTDARLLADNVLAHPEEISGYLAALEGLNVFDLLVPVDKGPSVAYRVPDASRERSRSDEAHPSALTISVRCRNSNHKGQRHGATLTARSEGTCTGSIGSGR